MAPLVKKGMIETAPISKENPVRLASRASQLAMAQTHEVARRLDQGPDQIACAIEALSTRGDEVLDRSLAELGGKGLFVKTLEAAMLDGRAEAAVHSAKDMESDFAEGTIIAAFLEREDRRDALIGPFPRIDDLPDGAVVGTASVRRSAMLKSRRPDLRIRLLRGNVNSRLQQLADGDYDAIILAMAGMNRLGTNRLGISTTEIHPIAEDIFLPAAGQGAIAVQALAPDGSPRRDAVLTALKGLDHPPTAIELNAERALLAALDGTCRTPIGASARFDNRLTMKAALFSPDGSQAFFAAGEAQADDAAALGQRLAIDLLEQAGGRAFLAETGG